MISYCPAIVICGCLLRASVLIVAVGEYCLCSTFSIVVICSLWLECCMSDGAID